MKGLSGAELVQKLVDKCVRSSQRQVAAELGFSAAYISDVINFNRPVSKVLAEKLGYYPKTCWMKNKEN